MRVRGEGEAKVVLKAQSEEELYVLVGWWAVGWQLVWLAVGWLPVC